MVGISSESADELQTKFVAAHSAKYWIGSDPQNKTMGGFAGDVKLERESPGEARAVYERWITGSFPTMNRLAVRAATLWQSLEESQRGRALLDG